MNPLWLDLLEPYILSKLIGHDKVPMFFWGPLSGPGVVGKIRTVASLRDNEDLSATQPPILFFSNDLDPDGCLVADQLRTCTKILESTGADKKKGLLLKWRLTLQKNKIIFCDGEVFSLDRGLLMGAINTSLRMAISITYILFLTELQKRQIPENGFALIEKRYNNFWTGIWDCRYIAAIHGLRLTIFLPNQLTHVMIWIHDSRQQSCILVPKARPQDMGLPSFRPNP